MISNILKSFVLILSIISMPLSSFADQEVQETAAIDKKSEKITTKNTAPKKVEITNTDETKPIEENTQTAQAPSIENARHVFLEYYNNEQNFEKAIDILNKILKNDPKNADALVLLSRIWLTYGHYIQDNNSEEKWNRFAKGSDIAQKAIKADSSNPDAYFYYVANEASLAKSKGIFGSFFLVKKLKKNVDKVLELNPNHIEGIALKGAILNAIPGIMGGDVKEAESLLRKALAMDPHLTSTKIFLAKNLYKQEQYDTAKLLFNEVLDEKSPTVLADWYLNKRSALKWLKIIDKKEHVQEI